MSINGDKIELLLPFKAEYVSVARLLASGVASKLGLDIETIEDIKVAISEVCSKFIKVGSDYAENYKIIFEVTKSKLNVIFDCEDKNLRCLFNDEDDQLGISIINALMDYVEFCADNNYILSMSKMVEGNM